MLADARAQLAVGGRSTEKLTAAVDDAAVGHCGVTEDDIVHVCSG